MGREGLTAGHHTESHQIRHIFPTSPHSQLCLKEPLHMLRALISNRKERACKLEKTGGKSWPLFLSVCPRFGTMRSLGVSAREFRVTQILLGSLIPV